MSNEKNDEIMWQRDIIEKLLLEKKIKKSKKWLWILLIMILLFLILITSSSLISVTKGENQEHIATLDLLEEVSDNNETLDKLTEGLKDIYSNQKYVRAIIIKASSPGGSPVISDIAYQEIRYYKQKYPNIPIYAVIGDMCASGCYYIVTATDKIYANRSSVVGSIGVIMPSYDLRGLADKLGIKDRTKTAGKNKALGNPFQEETSEQVEIFNSILNEIHSEFIQSVKDGRGDKLKWQVNSDVFTGRIYTGIEGKNIGLIDDFGNIYSVSRKIMKEPVLVDYTPDDNFANYIRKTIKMGIKSYIFNFLESTVASFK